MHLQRLLTLGAVAALPMALAPTASALDIDDFSLDQLVASAAVGSIEPDEQDTGAVLGGERDFAASGGSGLLGTTGIIDDGVLNFSNSPTSQGSLTLVYDGIDGNPLTTPLGLGGEDLTDGGLADAFIFTLLFSDFEVEYQYTVTDMSGDSADFSGVLPTGIAGGGDEVDIFAPFADFSDPSIDFNNVGSLVLTLNATEPAADIVIDDLRTGVVPEPSSVALLLAGGALLARRRRRA